MSCTHRGVMTAILWLALVGAGAAAPPSAFAAGATPAAAPGDSPSAALKLVGRSTRRPCRVSMCSSARAAPFACCA
jgi:hypothetical protein